MRAPGSYSAPRVSAKRDPDNSADGLCTTAHALHLHGDLSGAINGYTAALTITPTHGPALHGLGLACHQLGRHTDAVALLRRACDLAPSVAEYQNNLGSVLAAMRQFEEAIVCHFNALRLQPTFAEAHNNLGNALREIGKYHEALLCFSQAQQLKPDDAVAYVNQGTCLRALRRVPEAIAAYERACALAPCLVDAHNNLGTAYKDAGRWEEALLAYRRALELAPDSALVHYNLGTAYYQLGCLEAAHKTLARAAHLAPTAPETHLNLGNVAKDQGRLEAALASFRQALALCPTYHAAHSNLLFTMNYVDGVSPQEIFDLHRDFNARHAARYAVEGKSHANTREPARRLKIGYISPDFRAHACAFFVKPIFENHSRDAVEVYAYAEVANPDAVTAELRALTDEWRSTVGLSDAQVAAMIRADEVDVLVDLAGHTANARLLALARKPAPVQVTYLGYPATTGLDVMDYRLTDGVTEPVGSSERYYTEELVRLPQCLWCYAPFADMPAVTALPALTNGYVTFGSFNNFAKIGPRVIELWAAVLRAVPNSRITLITIPAGTAQAELRDRFAALGVATERVVMHDRLLRREYLDLFSEVDIALDPFPCNGGTTTCDALWMGLPVVALTGETFLSRASFSVLTAAGLTEFAVNSSVDYVATCVRSSEDISRLAALRAGLRAQLAASALLDSAGFTSALEQTYRALWRRYCAEQPV